MNPPADTMHYKNHRFPGEIISHGVWLYYRFTLSYRDVQELLFERGITVSHEAIRQWCRKFGQDYANRLRRRRPQPGDKWYLDETYIKVKGQWRYLYRAVDKHGQTIDFLLTEHRDKEAALRFLKKAIRRNGVPETITIDGSDANEAAIKSYNEEYGTHIAIRQVKYLNNIVEQDHRGVKRITRPLLGFKAFDAAQSTLVGVELMPMIKKRQLVVEEGNEGLTAAELFYSLAA